MKFGICTRTTPPPLHPSNPGPGFPDAAALLVPADGAAGQTTCAGRAGGLYHEYIDAATYAEWGAEYLKYDVRAHPHTRSSCARPSCPIRSDLGDWS